MAKARQRGTMRQRGVHWDLRAYVGVGPNGKPQFLYKTVNGKEPFARRALHDLVDKADALGSARQKSGGRTVGALLDTCIKRHGPHWSPRTLGTHRHCRSRYLSALCDLPLEDLTPDKVSAHYGKLLTGEITGEPLAPATVVRAHNFLRRCCQSAFEWGWMTSNPASNIRIPRPRPAEPVLPVDGRQIAGVVKMVASGDTKHRPDSKFALAIQIAALTGMRRGELCGLRWSDIDWEQSAVTIQRGVVNGELLDGTKSIIVREAPKTHRSNRTISVSAQLVDSLKAAHEEANAVADACGVVCARGAYVLSDDPAGSTCWSPARITRRWGRSRNRLGLEDVDWHCFRHYHISYLLRSGVSIQDVAKRAGDSEKTIMQIYAHAIPSQDQRSAALISQDYYDLPTG